MVLSLGGRSAAQKTRPQRSRYSVRVTPLYSPMHRSVIESGVSGWAVTKWTEKLRHKKIQFTKCQTWQLTNHLLDNHISSSRVVFESHRTLKKKGVFK